MNSGNSLTLVVLAAGIGSRYGGLKQIDPVGPSGEIVIDYSIYDALKAGFNKVVFIINHKIESDFKRIVGEKISKYIDVDYVFQEIDSLPEPFNVPAERAKPWGTGHAVLAAEEKIDGPFAVINADDFYGAESYKLLAKALTQDNDNAKDKFFIVPYILKNTLTEHGKVARGICEIENNLLKNVVEFTEIFKTEQGAENRLGTEITSFTGNEFVSMNLWGFTPALFTYLKKQFPLFLKNRINEEKSEFFLPFVVDQEIANGNIDVLSYSTSEQWFGVTYAEDKQRVVDAIADLVNAGKYPKNLWESYNG